MISALALGLRLAWPTAFEARVRSALVVVVSAAVTVVMLSALGVSHAEQSLHPLLYSDADSRRVLQGTVIAVTLPALAALAGAATLSARLRERRLTNLRLLGVSAVQARAVAATEVAAVAVVGSLLGAAAFWPIRHLLALLRVAGRSWPVESLTPSLLTVAATVAACPATIAIVAGLARRTAATPAHSSTDAPSRPTLFRLAPLVAGLAIGGYVVSRSGSLGDVDSALVPPFLASAVLTGVGVILLSPVVVRLLADGLVRWGRRPAALIAGRRLQGQPAAVNRLVAGLLLGLFLVTGARVVLVAFEAVPQYADAASQVETRQTASLAPAPYGPRTERLAARAAAIPGVRAAAALPVLQSLCGPNGICGTAVVASCSQLRALSPGLADCRPGVPGWVAPEAEYGTVADPRAAEPADLRRPQVWHPLFTTSRRLAGAPRVRAPGAGTRLEGIEDLMDTLGAEVVLPPSTPGVDRVASGTRALVIVVADPGRDLPLRLDRAGLAAYMTADFTDYDLVAQLRAVVWAVAAVVLSLGLLTFVSGGVDRALSRRREITSLQLLGAPVQSLRSSQWVEAAAPLVVGCVLAVGCGLWCGATYLSVGGIAGSLPWSSTLALLAVAGLGSLAAAGLTVIASSPRLRPDMVRRE